jgi:hypothetical protein
VSGFGRVLSAATNAPSDLSLRLTSPTSTVAILLFLEPGLLFAVWTLLTMTLGLDEGLGNKTLVLHHGT